MKTQQIANKFPRYSKMRRDPSSMGQRMFYRVGELLDDMHTTAVQIKDSMRLFSRSLGVDAGYTVSLLPADYMQHTVRRGGGVTPTYPTTVTGDLTTLERVETFEELFYGAANQYNLAETVSYTNRTVWTSSAPAVFNAITHPEFLAIEITNGKNYKRRGTYGPNADARFYGEHCILIEGYDFNNNFFSEKVTIFDDGVHHSARPVSELTKVTLNGFEADVSIFSVPGQLGRRVDPFRDSTTADKSGPLEYYLEDISGASYLVWVGKEVLRGDIYRSGEEPIDDNDRIIAKQALLDSAGNPVVAVDFAVSPHNTLVHVLDQDGDIHVYYPSLQPFTPPANVSRDTYIELRPDEHRVALGSRERIATFFARPKFPITQVQIKRVTPSAVEEYLQSDRTWSATPHTFSGNIGSSIDTILKTWNDISFYTTYNEIGEWKYYALVGTSNDLTTYATAVMVESNQALTTMPTVRTGSGCYFSESGHFCIYDSTDIYKYDLWRAAYVAHFATQQLWFNYSWSSIVVDGSTPYPATWVDIPNVIDDIGVEFSMDRFTEESLASYRKRIAAEAFGPARTRRVGLMRSFARHLGLEEKRVFVLDLVLDGSGEPVAADPYVEITSTRLRAYNDHANSTVSVEIDFTDNSNGAFLADIVTAFSGNAYFSLTTKTDYDANLLTSKLMTDNSERYFQEYVKGPTVFQTAKRYLDNVWFNNRQVFVTEEASVNDVDADGDFHIDHTNGVITAYNNITSMISYTHRNFPMDVYYQPARGFEWDADIKYRAYDQQIDDATGTASHTLLNAEGANLLAKVHALNPLQWGE